MIQYSSKFEIVERDFLNKDIPINSPGFYNHKNFIKEERKNPEYLSNYARYVQGKSYDNDYIQKAKKEIPIICNELFQELKKDGRKGACVDASVALSKMLEKEGYWNYVVKGALTLKFSEETKIRTKYFWPIDPTNPSPNMVGHVWLAAPPFNVIDVTVKMQPYKDGEERYLPDMVIEEVMNKCSVEAKDIFSPEAFQEFLRMGIPEKNAIRLTTPHIEKFSSVFTPNKLLFKGTEMKYVPVAATAGEEELEDIKGLSLNGKYAYAIFEEIVKPQLAVARE